MIKAQNENYPQKMTKYAFIFSSDEDNLFNPKPNINLNCIPILRHFFQFVTLIFKNLRILTFI